VQKNVCGMITTLLMYAAFCVKPRGALQRSALILFVLTAIVIVIMSQSRTAWILLAMSLFFIALLRVYGKLRNHERLLFVLSLAFIITAMASAAIAYTPQIAIALGKDPTLTGRLEIWRAIAPELWKRPLLGYGYRAFWLGMKGESWNVSTALGSTIAIGNSENAILEIWLELGVIGVVLALLMLFQVCRNAATCLSEDSPRYIHWYILIVFFNLVSLVDGEKIMFPHTIEWVLFVMAYVGLSAEARRLRSERAE